MFKNLSLFKLPADFKYTRKSFESALEKAAFKPVSSLETQSRGFISPYPDTDEGAADAPRIA
jgi:DNA recombination-dependent growth factor C